ncbi:hypothetical protein DYB34_011055 [Aphanomyces astaci]|uniref:Fe2OG dioxygenase domain-containing protein n=1 Tax=Aphanomyces astaci TaxID=112090 RepID=A0A418BFC4_APHAT|nr:hypothetical protein DYB34_011055 [Aphanomyces astaci]
MAASNVNAMAGSMQEEFATMIFKYSASPKDNDLGKLAHEFAALHNMNLKPLKLLNHAIQQSQPTSEFVEHLTHAGWLAARSVLTCRQDIMFEVLDSVLTEAECRALINRMSPALKSVSGALSRLHPLGEQRASKTEYCLSVMENKRFADVIWQRLMDSEAFASIYKYTQREGCGMPLGLAPRLRLLRYEGSDRFDAHYDRIVPDEATGSESLITVLIYLNDGGGVDFSGGETLYINPENMAESVGVVPQRGRVVLFEHCLYHSGSPLQHIDDSANQRKYVMRTDILFRIQAKNHDKY